MDTHQPDRSSIGFLDALRGGVLIGDGAMGTELFARGATPEAGVERLNLRRPELVQQVHAEYVAAGSRVLETNTFGANRAHLARYQAADEVHAINTAGVALARAAARPGVFVAGSVGPLGTVDGEPPAPAARAAIFAEQISALLDGGVDLLLFETFTDLDELTGAISVARALAPLPIVAQMAFVRDGVTAGGDPAEDVARRCRDAGADVVGVNCGDGAMAVLAAIRRMADPDLLLSAYLNAGFPEQVEGRLLYRADTAYLVERARDLLALGVRLIGGCCGTSPETIRAFAQALSGHAPARVTVRPPEARPPLAASAATTPTTLPAGARIVVEVDPPTTLDLAPVLAAARELTAAGADALTVADNPLASVRVDTLTVAGLLQRDTGVPVVAHLTGRDRNRIALQSVIMGAHVQGLRSLLCVTGDPIRMYQEPNTSGVFDVTSVGLVRLVAEFNDGRRLPDGARTAFAIGVALNPNVRTISGQVSKLQRKIEAGAHFALTQPVFSAEPLDILLEAMAAAGVSLPVYLGIMPLLSARNAEFLHHEVPGMQIPEDIRQRLARYARVEDQRAAAVEIAAALVERLVPRVHGCYLIAPRNRANLVTPLIRAARSAVPFPTPA